MLRLYQDYEAKSTLFLRAEKLFIFIHQLRKLYTSLKNLSTVFSYQANELNYTKVTFCPDFSGLYTYIITYALIHDRTGHQEQGWTPRKTYC